QQQQVPVKAVPIIRHPPGWILRYGVEEEDELTQSSVQVPPPLHTLALRQFADYFDHYEDAMGSNQLHAALSVLPPESLAELSILISSSCKKDNNKKNDKKKKNGGINDRMLVLLAKHGHVEQLCLRAASLPEDDEEQHEQEEQVLDDDDGDDDNNNSIDDDDPNHRRSLLLSSGTLTDRGLLALMPPLSLSLQDQRGNNNSSNNLKEDNEYVPDCWEDDEECDADTETEAWADNLPTNNIMSDPLHAHAALNIKLRRLELLDCQHISAPVLLQLLERCSGITHLSLAGSFVRNPQDGIDVLSALPQALPKLQVLDVTRCPWVVASLLNFVKTEYENQREGSDFEPPTFVSQVSNVHTMHRPGLWMDPFVDGEW
ncbi:MAG: hypothetical protein SGILL_007423, partial [Bacillariaceae sp.]